MVDPLSKAERNAGFALRSFRRAIWLTAAVLAVLLVVFAGYYYWDRYANPLVRAKDKAPVEMRIEMIEEAIRKDPQNPEKRVALAEAYLQNGMAQQALDQATQVLKFYPENEGALLVSGNALVRLGQADRALAPLEQFIALRARKSVADADTRQETAYYFLGEAELKLGHYDKAIAALQAALAIDPVDADALYQVGLAYQASGQPKIALDRLSKAARLVPDFAEVYAALDRVYADLGQPDHQAYARGMQAFARGNSAAALPQLEQATRQLPDFAPAFLGLGLAYEKAGRQADALKAVQRALELTPHDFGAQQAYGRLQAGLDTRQRQP
jgi:tetratricopeptide (TPR) repeat protein